MATPVLLLPLCLLWLCAQIQASRGYGKTLDENCTFLIPATDDPSLCETYDLSQLATLGGVTVATGKYSYVLNVCVDVASERVPAVCSSKKPAPAYQYNATDCYVAGELDAAYVLPVDPTNSSVGIRIAYGNGEGGAKYWTRAVIYDFVCDPNAGVGKPLSVLEFPDFTYTVRWPTTFACPGQRVMSSCPLPKFDGTWNTVRFRPRPPWFDRVKFGIFIHWGVFSVPSFKNEWYWKRLMEGTPEYVEFHNRVYGCSGVKPDKFPCTGPNFTYPQFAPMFKATFFDPDQWADLFKKAGAKYVVLTSKHHEGWCNFKGIYHWNWNSVDLGPKRDLVGDLTKSVRAAGLHMGLYHSLREWYNPLYLQDNADNCATTDFVDEILTPTLKEIVYQYQPDLIWADGAGDAPCTHDSVHYWKAPEFLTWLYDESPINSTVVVNSRWGHDSIGDYQTGGDRFTPGQLLPYKWESAFTIQHTSWGYDRTEGIADFWNATRLVWQLVSSVSCNGNLLLNVGPTVDGVILPAFQEKLLQMGAWLEINGEAIYDTVPWRIQNDTEDQQTWYTASMDGTIVYAITFKAPTPGSEVVLHHPVASSKTEVSLLELGYALPLSFVQASEGLHIKFPLIPPNELKHAWTFKMTHVE